LRIRPTRDRAPRKKSPANAAGLPLISCCSALAALLATLLTAALLTALSRTSRILLLLTGLLTAALLSAALLATLLLLSRLLIRVLILVHRISFQVWLARSVSSMLPGQTPESTFPRRLRSAWLHGHAARNLQRGCEFPLHQNEPQGHNAMGRYLLLWLLGIPLPILLLIWVFGGLH
jgi:hypothetical protein